MGAEFGEGAVNCEADVAIVGYGPVGATLANLLGQSGISTLVLEREEAAYGGTSAAALAVAVRLMVTGCQGGVDM